MSGVLLDQIRFPADLRKFSITDLPTLSVELRQKLIEIVSKTGGHLGSNLGVIELTIALHYVFNTPVDKIIWDVGHQAYAHKILTGRHHLMETLRQTGGLSGFTKRSESIFDPFGAAHSSTSISAGLGMATARNLNGDTFEVISVIGDGALSAGMAYEALNNAGSQHSRILVILNDNNMSIAPPVGSMSSYLSRALSSSSFLSLREIAKNISHHLPRPLSHVAEETDEMIRGLVTGGTFFEEMGFYYIGPVDGHNVIQLVHILDNIKKSNLGPVFLHVITRKGKGYPPAEQSADKLHGVVQFDIQTGQPIKKKSSPGQPTYTQVFAKTLCQLAKTDPKIVAITAAMPSGTGLDLFQKYFPERTFDVGIAEQHAVTFAGGLACEGFKPFVAIYSTFLQRAYDQVIHDIVLQSLPVRFMLDRAGLVGADGPTHAGSFDLAYLCCLPNIIIMAPANEQDFTEMIKIAHTIDTYPCAIRYPRGHVHRHNYDCPPVVMGKGHIIQQGKQVAILNLGGRLEACLDASHLLKEHNMDLTIANARFAKPLDQELIKNLAQTHDILITIEEGSTGGFAALVHNFLLNNDLIGRPDNPPLRVRNFCLPDCFLNQSENVEHMYHDASLDAYSIAQQIRQLLS